jgi:hypothetical protein
MAIDKAEIIQDTYVLFFDLLSDQTKIPDTQTPARSKFWYSSEPDFIYSDTASLETFKKSLPLGLIEVSLKDWSEFTLTKKYATVNILIEWFTTTSENCDKYGDKIIDTIETYRKTLADNGLRNVNLISSNKNIFYRGAFKVHVNAIEFEGRVYFTKTQVW